MEPWTVIKKALPQCSGDTSSMEPWTVIKKALPQCSGDTSSCLGRYPTAACPEFPFGCRLGRELFTLPLYKDHIWIKEGWQ